MNLEIVGEEIWFGPWKLGRQPDAMPATQWDECQYLAGLDLEQIEVDKQAAVRECEEELAEETRGYLAQIDALETKVSNLESSADEAYDAGYAQGVLDGVKECKAAGAAVQDMKRELKRRMGK